MSRLFASIVLAGLLLGGALLVAMPSAKSCPAGCCRKPADCPQPTCGVKQ